MKQGKPSTYISRSYFETGNRIRVGDGPGKLIRMRLRQGPPPP